jgi:hypothetical protein
VSELIQYSTTSYKRDDEMNVHYEREETCNGMMIRRNEKGYIYAFGFFADTRMRSRNGTAYKYSLPPYLLRPTFRLMTGPQSFEPRTTL